MEQSRLRGAGRALLLHTALIFLSFWQRHVLGTCSRLTAATSAGLKLCSQGGVTCMCSGRYKVPGAMRAQSCTEPLTCIRASHEWRTRVWLTAVEGVTVQMRARPQPHPDIGKLYVGMGGSAYGWQDTSPGSSASS